MSTRPTPRATFRRTIQTLRAINRRLTQHNEALQRELDSLVPSAVTYTTARAIRRGETIRVRIPKPFVPR